MPPSTGAASGFMTSAPTLADHMMGDANHHGHRHQLGTQTQQGAFHHRLVQPLAGERHAACRFAGYRFFQVNGPHHPVCTAVPNRR